MKFLFGMLVGVYLTLLHAVLGLFVLYSMTTTESGNEFIDTVILGKNKRTNV